MTGFALNNSDETSQVIETGAMTRVRADRYDLVIVALEIAMAIVLYHGMISSGRYTYDEADYMYAASRGLTENYLDRSVIPFSTFVERGWEGFTHPEQRFVLSEFIRNSADISFYRHYHGPLYFYWLIAFDGGAGGEYRVRWASFLLFLITIVVAHVGCRTLLSGDSRAGATIASSLVASSPTLAETSSLITPHALFIPALLLTLFLLGSARKGCDRRLFFVAAACSALAMAAIEYAVLLVLTILMLGYMWRRTLFPDANWRNHVLAVLQAVGVMLVVLFFLWPGGFLKLTLIRNYVFFAYFAVSRAQSYGDTGIATLWLNRVYASPVQYVLILLGIIGLAWIWRRHSHPELVPFLVYGVLHALTSARNRSGSVTYVAALLPPLFVIAGGVAATLLEGRKHVIRAAAVCAMTFIIVVGAAFNFHLNRTTHVVERAAAYSAGRAIEQDDVRDSIIRWAAQRSDRRPALVPISIVATLHYYQENVRVVPYDLSESTDTLAQRALERRIADIIVTEDRSQHIISLLSVDRVVRINTIAKTGEGFRVLDIHVE